MDGYKCRGVERENRVLDVFGGGGGEEWSSGLYVCGSGLMNEVEGQVCLPGIDDWKSRGKDSVLEAGHCVEVWTRP